VRPSRTCCQPSNNFANSLITTNVASTLYTLETMTRAAVLYLIVLADQAWTYSVSASASPRPHPNDVGPGAVKPLDPRPLRRHRSSPVHPLLRPARLGHGRAGGGQADLLAAGHHRGRSSAARTRHAGYPHRTDHRRGTGPRWSATHSPSAIAAALASPPAELATRGLDRLDGYVTVGIDITFMIYSGANRLIGPL
jgi:hypothetical protein